MPPIRNLSLPFLAAALFATALRADDAPAPRRALHLSPTPIAPRVQAAGAPALPPLPAGVEELSFAEFYKMPVGPRGLEPGARLQSLDGKKVRLAGWFVFEDWSTCSCTPTTTPARAPGKRAVVTPGWMKHVVPGRAMLAAVPTAVSLGHYDLCDDLPPQVAYLHIAPQFGEPVFYRPGFFAVTGTLALGNKTEADQRISFVRLAVAAEADIVPVGPPPAALSAAPFPDKTNPTTPTPTSNTP